MTTGSALNVVLKLFQPADRTVHGSCVAFTLQVSDCVQSLANQIVEIEEGQTPTNLKAALPGFAGLARTKPDHIGRDDAAHVLMSAGGPHT